MGKYRIEWREGTRYWGEVLASSEDEAIAKIGEISDKHVIGKFIKHDDVRKVSGPLLKYSSIFTQTYSNCTHEEMLDFIKKTDKPFVYTHGLEYRRPGIHRVPITREEAIKHFSPKCATVNAEEEKDCVHINRLSGSDLD